MKKKEVEKQIDFIKDKYYNEKLSMQKIGELIGCSADTICRVMKENGLKAYKVQINTGKDAGQEVMHLHIHIMGKAE